MAIVLLAPAVETLAVLTTISGNVQIQVLLIALYTPLLALSLLVVVNIRIPSEQFDSINVVSITRVVNSPTLTLLRNYPRPPKNLSIICPILQKPHGLTTQKHPHLEAIAIVLTNCAR